MTATADILTIETGPRNARTDPDTGLRYNACAGTSSAIANTDTMPSAVGVLVPPRRPTTWKGLASMGKTCSRCGVTKPANAFRRGKVCRDCENRRYREVWALKAAGAWSGRAYPRTSLVARLHRRTVLGEVAPGMADECWVWTGSSMSSGYGQIATSKGDAPALAHRVAYEAEHGPLAPGMELDHICETKRCVRPSHLEPLTKAEHSRRSCLRLDMKRPGWRAGA